MLFSLGIARPANIAAVSLYFTELLVVNYAEHISARSIAGVRMPSVTACESPEAFNYRPSQLLLGGVVYMARKPVAVISPRPQLRLIRCHNLRQRIQLYRVTVRETYGYASVLDVIEFIGGW